MLRQCCTSQYTFPLRSKLLTVRARQTCRPSGQPSARRRINTMATGVYDEYLHVATEAAKVAGKIISEAFILPKNVHHKGAVDLVTETDKKCEAVILEHIRGAFPDHKFIGEETTSDQGFVDQLSGEPTWMVDPLDGTTNFVHKFPFVCVSIGLVIKGQVVVGVVYNPIMQELFSAAKGHGAYLNGQPIQCSETQDLGKALFATEIGTNREETTVDAVFDRINTLTKNMRSVRCCGSCALNLCGVAVGRLDAFYEIGFGGCWDVAAGSLIVTEAGGKVVDPDGEPFDVMSRRVLAGNIQIADKVSQLLQSCKLGQTEPPSQLRRNQSLLNL